MQSLSEPTLRPAQLQLNACAVAGEPVRGALSAKAAKWALTAAPALVEKFLKPPAPANPQNWLDERIGWGLVTFEQPGFTAQQYANNEDLCPLLRQLLEKRENTVVLRFRPGADLRYTLLRDYTNIKDVDIAQGPVGKNAGSIPRYLLLVGRPIATELPWSLQYLLGVNRCVGRLPFHPLDERLLAPYLRACLGDWADAECDADATLTWAVDHSAGDITHLMRQSIAEAVFEKYSGDPDLMAKAVRLVDAAATHARLRECVQANRPGMIVTTSHGMTGPIDKPDQMAAQLGLLVDQLYEPLQIKPLLEHWSPSGAIWYAHACCASGSDNGSRFAALFADGTPAQQVLTAVGALGAQVAPLPLALLSAQYPVRAFIGHIEPTFDWTLKQPATGQFLTSTLVQALYNELYLGAPIGHAFRSWYAAAGTHYAAWDASKLAYDGKEAAEAVLLYHNLAARDVQTLVLLGDPAVRLKAPPCGVGPH